MERRRSVGKQTLSKSKWRSLSDIFTPSLEEEEEGVHGFEEVRKHIKQGNEFTREISAVIQERADLESQYAKNLTKLSARLAKAAQTSIGTLADGWGVVAVEIDGEAELHKHFSQVLVEDIAKPIRSLAETQAKTRKPIEQSVDKAYESYQKRRQEEIRCKKTAFQVTKEREKLCEQVSSGKDSKGKPIPEKDRPKLDKSARKSEDNLRKIDKDYQDTSQKAECSRQEWETAVYKANCQLQSIEEQRISQMQEFMNKYNSHLSVIGPKLIKCCEKLNETVLCIDTMSDLHKVIEKKGTGANQPEQVLPDFYAEDFQNHMDKDRRRQMLQNYLIRYQQDIERETKSKEGIEKMVDVYTNKPNYADADTLEETRNRLSHIISTIQYLEASQFKIACAMSEVESRPKPSHRLSNYIERTKDKQGHTISLLKLPSSMAESYRGSVSDNRLPGDGGQPDSPFDADEFDSYPIGQCQAIYEYVATQSDELSIRPGDVITVFDKQADGWWQGEVNGRSGIFPGSYVEETQQGVRL